MFFLLGDTMAGSFHLFRRYQKAALAGLAIMAMLAFFVLPPLLQMDAGSAEPGNGLVVRWNGGGLRESDLERAGRTRWAVEFVQASLQAVAAGRDQPAMPDSPDERTLVTTILMAREAEANGIVISDAIVNEVLANVTGDVVSAAQVSAIVAKACKRGRVSESDIFNELRAMLSAQILGGLVRGGTDFSGAPPGWRWDAFRKLEQGATVEVVQVAVESLSGEVPEPTTAALEKLYAEYGDQLPQARSTTPGFREPARARYDAIVAAADLFVADAEKDVTDEAISKFYEENKETLYRKVIEPPATGEKDKAPEAATPEAKAEADPGEAAPEKAADPEPAADAPPADKPASDTKPAPESGARKSSRAIHQVAFRQPAEAKAAESAAETSTQPPAPEKAPETSAADAKAPEAKPAEEASSADKTTDETGKEAAQELEPLDKVRDDIRKRLARQAADRKIADAFGAVAAKVAAHSDAVEMAIGLGEKVPAQPDVTKLAAEHGLESVRSEFVTPAEAIRSGGIGGSFQIAFSERFGMRQQRWDVMVLAPEAPRFRPIETRDITGIRYLSWKTEDRPQFTPPFSEIRPEVERVWKLLEARPLARKRADAIAASAKSKTLAEAIAGSDGLQAKTVGPFTWLTRGTAPFGSAPMLSDPDGIEMAGEAFMEAVFSLEPGGTAVAFNEPETICYGIRLASLEPDEATLRERFRAVELDPRRLEALAVGETREAFSRWMADIEARHGVTWLRSPRGE